MSIYDELPERAEPLGGRPLVISSVGESLAPAAEHSPDGRDFLRCYVPVESNLIPRMAFYGPTNGIEARAGHAAQDQEAFVPCANAGAFRVAVQKERDVREHFYRQCIQLGRHLCANAVRPLGDLCGTSAAQRCKSALNLRC